MLYGTVHVAQELQGEDKKVYQSNAARANYLCLDRPDIGFATKEAMRRLSAPDKGDLAALKKIGKFLMGKPRMISHFRFGEECQTLVVEGDSDHAGCLETRQSSVGAQLLHGRNSLNFGFT